MRRRIAALFMPTAPTAAMRTSMDVSAFWNVEEPKAIGIEKGMGNSVPRPIIYFQIFVRKNGAVWCIFAHRLWSKKAKPQTQKTCLYDNK